MVNSSTSMREPATVGNGGVMLQQQQHDHQFLPEFHNSGNSRRSRSDFYPNCEEPQHRQDAAINNSIFDSSQLERRDDFHQQQQGRTFSSRNVEKITSPRGPPQSTYADNDGQNRISAFEGGGGPHSHLDPFPPPAGVRSRPCESASLQRPAAGCVVSTGETLRFEDLLLLRGGGGSCDNRCELGSSSHHHHHHLPQQQQGQLASERSLVLTESRNFTLSPETTDCDSGSWLFMLLWW